MKSTGSIKGCILLWEAPSWYCKSSKKKNIRKSYKCHRRVCRKYYTTTSKMNQNKKAVIKRRQHSPQNAPNVGCQSAEWRWRVFLSKHLHSSPTGNAKQKYLRTRVLFSHPSQFVFFFTYVFFFFFWLRWLLTHMDDYIDRCKVQKMWRRVAYWLPDTLFWACFSILHHFPAALPDRSLHLLEYKGGIVGRSMFTPRLLDLDWWPRVELGTEFWLLNAFLWCSLVDLVVNTLWDRPLNQTIKVNLLN